MAVSFSGPSCLVWAALCPPETWLCTPEGHEQQRALCSREDGGPCWTLCWVFRSPGARNKEHKSGVIPVHMRSPLQPPRCALYFAPLCAALGKGLTFWGVCLWKGALCWSHWMELRAGHTPEGATTSCLSLLGSLFAAFCWGALGARDHAVSGLSSMAAFDSPSAFSAQTSLLALDPPL